MRIVPLLLIGASLGCTQTSPPVAPVEPPAAPEAPPVDVSPVAEPADIFAVARWKSPNATLTGLSACSRVPDDVAQANARLFVDQALAAVFRGGVDARPIADIVAFDAPVDLVAALDTQSRLPQALVAFSIGLSSLEKAKQALLANGDLVEMAPGLYRVGARPAGDLTCAIGAGAGAAPARLVCGTREKDVTALGPYLARNLPVAEPPRTDLHAELRFTPIDARFGPLIRRGLGFLPSYVRNRTDDDPRLAAALEEAAGALADEGAALASDLDRISLDLGVDGSACLSAKAAIQLRGKTSWIAGAIADSGDKSGPPPAIFWRAPVDSDSATYGRATDVARYAGVFRALRSALDAKLAHDQIGTEADRKALGALVDLPFKRDTHVVVASGHTHKAASPAAGAGMTRAQAIDELVHNYLGWYLLGFDEGADATSKLLKEIVALYGKKSVFDPLRRELEGRVLPTAKLVKAPRELGKGALDLELAFALDPKAMTKVTVSLHVLLMPDGKNSWLAVGADRDELVKHLLAARSGSPDSGTLAARAGLEPLRAGKAAGSGFLTLAMFTRGLGAALGNPAVTRLLRPRGVAHAAELARAFEALPNKGDTPMFVVTEAAGGAEPRTQLSLQIQRGSFEDLGTVALTALRVFGRLPAAQGQP